ncbi:Mrp/NBP35 ATP-binding protein [Trinorchestia longiramus]|nr:Mrp/NBP35 ATP-binding protein [Trinorchestia longiramus]
MMCIHLILKNYRLAPFAMSSRLCHHDPLGVGKSQSLSEHQKKVMARGLPKKQSLGGVRNVILVASGKGGVGKSTTAVNLALALKQHLGSEDVGLLDMDIFGPSIPIMMNLHNTKPALDKDKRMVPLLNYGIHCMSVGLMVPADGAMIWRGPMVMSAVQQLLLRTAWPSLHTLLLDLPPGTGDVALSVAQLVQVTGAVLVSTPQDVALADVKRGAQMMQKVGVPVLGVVQNMSLHRCSSCGHIEHIFGRDGAARVAQQLGVPVLGDVPIALDIREAGDTGCPIAVTRPQSQEAECYRSIVSALLRRLVDLPPTTSTPAGNGTVD